MDIVTGALPSLIPKLADLVAGEYNLRKGVKGEIMALQDHLESVMGALEDSSRTPADQLDESTQDWSRKVRDLSYDMQSSVDRFMVRCKADKQARHHGFKDIIHNSVYLLIQPIIRHKFAAEIKNIKGRIHEMDRRRPRYNIDDNPHKYVTIDPRLSALFVEEAKLVGIDSAKAEMIKIMLEGNESSMQQGKIVSIVGFGGLGKTTLANVVYRELRKIRL